MRLLIRLLVLSSICLAAGCAYTPKQIPQEGAMSRQITWVLSDDPNEDCRKVSGGRQTVLPFKTLGCATWKDSTNCIIYVRAPKDEYDRRAMETLGHEVLHCFTGHFHRPLN